VPADAEKGTQASEITIVDEGATHFTLGVLDVFLMAHIYDKSTKLTRGMSEAGEDEVGIVTAVNATNIETVRYGLHGWTNLQDAGGNDLPFKTIKKIVAGREYTVCADETLSLLGIQLIGEIGQTIKTASEVGRAEAKNSATAS